MKPQELSGGTGDGIQENKLLHSWQALHSDFLAVHMLCIPQLAKQALAEVRMQTQLMSLTYSWHVLPHGLYQKCCSVDPIVLVISLVISAFSLSSRKDNFPRSGC